MVNHKEDDNSNFSSQVDSIGPLQLPTASGASTRSYVAEQMLRKSLCF